MNRPTPSDRRLRTALQFSILCSVLVFLVPGPLSRAAVAAGEGTFFIGGFAYALVVMTVLSFWLLLAALLERRPVFGNRVGRRVWTWAFAMWIGMGWLGWSSHGVGTLGSAALFAASLVIVVSGSIGLVVCALPLRSGVGDS
jgi:hypothetical protein